MSNVPIRSSVGVPLWRCVLLAGLPLLAGCAMQYSARSLGVPVTMAEPLAQPVPGDSFNVTVHTTHYFWGVVPGKSPNLQQALAGQLGAGQSVHSLSIRSEKTVTDYVFTVLTLGLISPTSVTFKGVVARTAP